METPGIRLVESRAGKFPFRRRNRKFFFEKKKDGIPAEAREVAIQK